MISRQSLLRNSLEIYSDKKTVDYYNSAQGLQVGEQLVFEKYIRRGDYILDIGVGGGRTTPYLSGKSDYYLGIDYSEPMIQACKRKFPNLTFATMDASTLIDIPDCFYDVVVFSFNGIDCLPTDELRSACLSNIWRVLKSGGIFIFSRHNPRVLFIKPDYRNANILRCVWRTLRLILNLNLVLRQLCRRAFYIGKGYIVDPVHGGHFMHVSTPRWVRHELNAHKFEMIYAVDSISSGRSSIFTAPGYYYVAVKHHV